MCFWLGLMSSPTDTGIQQSFIFSLLNWHLSCFFPPNNLHMCCASYFFTNFEWYPHVTNILLIWFLLKCFEPKSMTLLWKFILRWNWMAQNKKPVAKIVLQKYYNFCCIFVNRLKILRHIYVSISANGFPYLAAQLMNPIYWQSISYSRTPFSFSHTSLFFESYVRKCTHILASPFSHVKSSELWNKQKNTNPWQSQIYANVLVGIYECESTKWDIEQTCK